MQLPLVCQKEDNQISNHHLYYGDNLSILQQYVVDESVNLIYIDPPFNTGKLQKRTQIQVEVDAQGDRVGFQGKIYRTHKGETIHYVDKFESLDEYLQFLRPVLKKRIAYLTRMGVSFSILITGRCITVR